MTWNFVRSLICSALLTNLCCSTAALYCYALLSRCMTVLCCCALAKRSATVFCCCAPLLHSTAPLYCYALLVCSTAAIHYYALLSRSTLISTTALPAIEQVLQVNDPRNDNWQRNNEIVISTEIRRLLSLRCELLDISFINYWEISKSFTSYESIVFFVHE